ISITHYMRFYFTHSRLPLHPRSSSELGEIHRACPTRSKSEGGLFAVLLFGFGGFFEGVIHAGGAGGTPDALAFHQFLDGPKLQARVFASTWRPSPAGRTGNMTIALYEGSLRACCRPRNANRTRTMPVLHAPGLNVFAPNIARQTPPPIKIAARNAKSRIPYKNTNGI